MPMIDSDKLKAGLLPVQQAEAAWRQATSDRRAAAPNDRHAAFEVEDRTYKVYLRACVELYDYVQGAVNLAEDRGAAKDE